MVNTRLSLRGSRTLLISGALVLLLGVTGLLAGSQASSAAKAVHREDRMVLQTTLAGLVGQYTQISGGSLRDALAIETSSQPFSSTPSADSVARLRNVMRAAPLFDVGLALVGPVGTPLAASGNGLPARTDPGWTPLRASITSGAGTLPVSGLLDAGGRPAVAVALPVPLSDGTTGLVLGVLRADRGPLQGYVAGLRYGQTGRGYVVDGTGRVVAGPSPDVVGRPLPLPAVLRTVTGSRTNGLYDDEGVVASYARAGTTGWTAVTVQDHDEFLGDLERSGLLAQLALVAFLLFAGTTIVVLNRKREAALRHVALRDELTGVYNRRGWFALAEHELERARRTGQPRSLLFVDVDGLKVVNDVLGHAEGDSAIRAAADVLTRSCRRTDLVGRLGGDEFVLLLADGSDAEAAQKRLREILAEHNASSDAGFDLRLSAGAEAWSPADPCSVEELVRRADAVMYVDKTSRPHRNRALVRTPVAPPATPPLVQHADDHTGRGDEHGAPVVPGPALHRRP